MVITDDVLVVLVVDGLLSEVQWSLHELTIDAPTNGGDEDNPEVVETGRDNE